jgi:transketolase
MITIDAETVTRLKKKARQIRLDSVRAIYDSGPDRKIHIGPGLSYTDILVALYYHVMKIDGKNPRWPLRDRFVLSKGHGCIPLYAVLADLGFFSGDYLGKVRHIGSILQGHPDMKKTPGIDMTAGSLGNGLGAGVGMALSAKFDKRDSAVFVMIGDGELNEGVVWEACEAAAKYELDNLVAIVDKNNLQSSGCCTDIMPFSDIDLKWKSFGWETAEIDGHNMEEILHVFGAMRQKSNGRPKVVIAHTVKGRGVSFMENDNSWHQRAITAEELKKAIAELEANND